MNRSEKCRRLEERIEALLDGELSGNEEAALLRHIGMCERCASVRAGAEEIRAALAAGERPEPLRPVWAAVSERFDPTIHPRSSMAFRFGATFAVAAGIIIGLLLGSMSASSTTETGGVWSKLGSTITTQSESSLDQIYLSEFNGGAS